VFLPQDAKTGVRGVIIDKVDQKVSEISCHDNKLEGVNIFGWSLIAKLGLRIDGTM
jgi:hypothetical protein